jgi:undecaprenyl diphosphate synthase
MNTSTNESSSLEYVPQHIAVIMDGNGRWAQRRLLPRTAGHKKGVDAVRELIEQSAKLGVRYLTVFAFSSENWSRPEEEVSSLMELFAMALAREATKLHANDVKLSFIGERSRFSARLQQQMAEVEELTANNQRLAVHVAVNYGGRWDIAQAARKAVDAGEALTEQALHSHMSLSHLPEPELLIRTGGERRISNFLLWQCAYSELYFTDVLWPDFDAQVLRIALEWFAQRERRFGRTSEQVRAAA